MDTVKDIAALISAASSFLAIGFLRIASARFCRRVVQKTRVDQDDMLCFWRLGRWSCLFCAIAFGALAPIVFESGGVDFSSQSPITLSLVLAAIGAAIMFSANAVMTFGTEYSLKWRAKILGVEDR